MRRGLAVFAVWIAAASTAFAAGCSDDPEPMSSADAGSPDATPFPDAEPSLLDRLAAPEPPADPVFLPCPAGWTETKIPRRDGTDLSACDPAPEGVLTCPSDQAQFPGEPGCVTVGPPCPAGDWAEDLPEPTATLRVIFVKPGAVAGDGSRELPFGTIADGIGARGAGAAVIALAKGRYDESMELPSGVSVIGACAGETLISEPTSGLGYGLVNTTRPNVSVRNLRLLSERPGLWSLDQGELEAHDVIIESAYGFGVLVSTGGKISGSGIVVRNVAPAPQLPSVGMLGLEGQITLDRVAIEGVRGMAVFVQSSSTTVTLSRTAIRNLIGRPGTNELGRAVHVVGAGTLFLERSLIEHAKDSGVSVAEANSRAILTDVVVRDLDGNGDNTGSALQVAEGGHITGTRVWIEGARHSSLHGEKPGSQLELEHLILRDVQSDPVDRTYGRHVNLIEGSTAILRRVYASGARESSIAADGAGTSLLVEDIQLEDNYGRESDDANGSGIDVQNAATATITRAVLAGMRRSGVLANEGSIRASDLVVRDMGSEVSSGQTGMGIMSQDGAMFIAERVLVERARFYGAYASGGTLRLRDVVVRETLPVERHPDPDKPDFGMGLVVTSGVLEVERALVENNRAAGIAASGSDTIARIEDAIVRNTNPDARGLFGEGIYTERNAHLELRKAIVDNNRELGVYANLGASVLLEDVEVSRTESNIEGVAGYGIYALNGGTMEVTRAKVFANRIFGVAAELEGSSIILREVEVRDTRRSSEASLIEVDGTGLAARDGGYLRATEFVVADNKLCGVMVAEGAMDLSRGVVRNSLIGANVRAEGFSLDRLMDQVRYEDNVTNLDSSELAIPVLQPPVLDL